ncbi:hypothetical protein ASPWEDRAFT_42211 [Aspergillus wentii DTO 134E9]|uniref:RRM domain-containing protein n=1 Tax=Aspergillus wentii DTO 134E9 TaxID=1073089 RepID=A0A1L9RH50_ASPWE|nr:uncharacterized protein ASPWEDRAFT_42211 [Aspergillus wentii DTO 134E9]KAI9928035.1 hypothetical protein MW887_002887 [Aspergillus wentii]OJJ34261.1 hypothetical protein ASPWEDRAFT_42211 [Aspergillus wentii DTO 134E9]
MAGLGEGSEKKRKLHDGPELEIDVSAPEPPSKKALRKAKKKGNEPTSEGAAESKTQTTDQEASTKQQRSDYGIWIGNLGFNVSKDDLRQFLTSNCSFAETSITRINMPKGAERFGRVQNKGFAYVDFSSAKALNEALGLSEQLFSGRRVLIKNSKSFEGRPEKSQDEQKTGSASGHAPSRRIFVGNLGFDATKEVIEEHFGQCGTVAHVHVATFQDSGKCKGYGWVEFEELPAAEAAVKGYVFVPEDDEEEEEEEEDEGEDADSGKRKPVKAKKPRQRKIWVNNLLGRRMRMEFAEDATTRYKKRFGKEGEGKRQDGADIAEVDNYQDATREQTARSRPERARRQKPEYTRYDQETVQKLSGAIVESQGKKTTFD